MGRGLSDHASYLGSSDLRVIWCCWFFDGLKADLQVSGFGLVRLVF